MSKIPSVKIPLGFVSQPEVYVFEVYIIPKSWISIDPFPSIRLLAEDEQAALFAAVKTFGIDEEDIFCWEIERMD